METSRPTPICQSLALLILSNHTYMENDVDPTVNSWKLKAKRPIITPQEETYGYFTFDSTQENKLCSLRRCKCTICMTTKHVYSCMYLLYMLLSWCQPSPCWAPKTIHQDAVRWEWRRRKSPRWCLVIRNPLFQVMFVENLLFQSFFLTHGFLHLVTTMWIIVAGISFSCIAFSIWHHKLKHGLRSKPRRAFFFSSLCPAHEKQHVPYKA